MDAFEVPLRTVFALEEPLQSRRECPLRVALPAPQPFAAAFAKSFRLVGEEVYLFLKVLP